MSNEANYRNPAADANLEPNSGDAPDEPQETPRFTTPCRLSFTHTRAQLADLDNLSVKAAIDGVVHAGVLADDTPQQVAEITTDQVKGKPEKTVIVIETLTRGTNG